MIITILRKPLEKSVEFNTLNHGCGAINIDAIRIAYEKGGSLATNPSLRGSVKGGNGGYIIATETISREMTPHKNGRWPANFILIGNYSVSKLDEQSGQVKGWSSQNHNTFNPYQGNSFHNSSTERQGYKEGYNDNGGASRFFKQFKKEEPNEP